MIKVPIRNYCDRGKRIKAGDETTFHCLFNELYQPVLNRAIEVLKNYHDADEATQDVFVKLWQKKGNWNPDLGTFMGWFITLAERSIIDSFRKQIRSRKKVPYSVDYSILGDEEEADAEVTVLELLADTKSNPLDLIIADETMHRIEAILLTVRHEHRLAWILRHVEGYKPPEIAKIMGYPVGTCKIWIYRCNHQIRAELEATDGDPK